MSEDNFFERVCSIARQIPFGRVTSYGAIAKQLVRADQHEWWAMP
jgi:methylated-DNA-protein-cysteine methyltransferase-like protein